MLIDEMHYKLMKLLEADPRMSQRDAARELGISLGKVNYCVRALIRKGWVKVSRFKNSRNKAAYVYLLTRRGAEEKGRLTLEFLHVKMTEYEELRAEIERMQQDVRRGH
jgi:EPS-associated MarR family transcriptional regulator